MAEAKEVLEIPEDMPDTMDAPEAEGEVQEVEYGNYC